MTKQTKNKPRCPKSLPIEGEVGGGLSLRGWVGVSSYGFGQLAQLYYPDRGERSAVRLFREELKLTRGLWDALAAVGYKPYTKVLTRGQVKTIVQFLGEP